MSKIIAIAQGELGTSVKDDPERVRDYINTSAAYSIASTKASMYKISWCGHIAYRVLMTALGEDSCPEKARAISKVKGWNTISRFFDKYETWDPKSDTQWPSPGDMYYMPKHPQFGTVHHVGFVESINFQSDSKTISTIDGNNANVVTFTPDRYLTYVKKFIRTSDYDC